MKKMLMTFLLLSIIVFSVVGCSNKKAIVATVNGEAISEQLYRINLWSTQRGLEVAQPNYWSFDNIYGKSPEEYAKDKTLQAITYCIVVEQKAKELDIKLTKEEKAKIKEAAKTAMKENEAFAKQYGIRQKDYEAYYTFAVQNEKVLAVLADSYEPNETEVNEEIAQMKSEGNLIDEATIVHILFNTKNEQGEEIPNDKKQEVYNEAEEVLQRALNGEDMSTLALAYSDDASVSENSGIYSFKYGSGLGNVIDEVVFNEAKVGEVYPKVIETQMGYEIIKVLDVIHESAADMRERAILPIKNEYARRELEEMTNFADVQKTEVYDTIHAGNVEIEQAEEDNN